MDFIKLSNIEKTYSHSNIVTSALDNINLVINQGDMIGLMGPSGSGKSTVLNILGLLDKQTKGTYFYNGIDVSNMSNVQLSKLRNRDFSFIFQHFALIKEYSVIENVMLPLNLRRIGHKEKINIAKKYLSKLGIEDQAFKKPSQLSGGQQQRVAIARALCQESKVILADEPTGALDQKTGKDIMEILVELNKEGKTIIIVTHDTNVNNYCTKKILIEDGKIKGDR